MTATVVRPSVDKGSTEKTGMVHLGPPGTPATVTYCGAKTTKYLPDALEVDCVVCVEMAKSRLEWWG